MTDPLKIGSDDELGFLLKRYTNLKDNNVLISTCTIVLWNENGKSMLQEERNVAFLHRRRQKYNGMKMLIIVCRPKVSISSVYRAFKFCASHEKRPTDFWLAYIITFTLTLPSFFY